MSNLNKRKAGVASSGGGRPIMRSVNILMTPEMASKVEYINPESRSAAVRCVINVVLNAYAADNTWIIRTIKEQVDDSSPRKRREDSKSGTVWNKAIVWIPENMYREIDRIANPNGMKVSEFLRGSVMFATEYKRKT